MFVFSSVTAIVWTPCDDPCDEEFMKQSFIDVSIVYHCEEKSAVWANVLGTLRSFPFLIISAQDIILILQFQGELVAYFVNESDCFENRISSNATAAQYNFYVGDNFTVP